LYRYTPALGDTEDCTAAEMAKKVEWVRANELSVVRPLYKLRIQFDP
jgi:hypothetical protein